MKPTKKWWIKARIYQFFSNEYKKLDFSHEAALQLFVEESTGEKMSMDAGENGWSVGKKWMNVNIAAWKHEIAQGLLMKYELFEDKDLGQKDFIREWLTGVLRNVDQGTHALVRK